MSVTSTTDSWTLPSPLVVRLRAPSRPEGSGRIVEAGSEGVKIVVRDPVLLGIGEGERVTIGFAGAWSTRRRIRAVDRSEEQVAAIVENAAATDPFSTTLARELMAAGASAADLKGAGLSAPRLTEHVEFRRATRAEMGQIIHLRTLAYRSAGKFAGEGELTDSYDADAIHVCAFFRGAPVAAMRLMLPDSEGPLEHEAYFQWRDTLPARTDIVEISRVCVHPDYQRCRILEGLFQRAATEVVVSGRSWILGSATDKLLPMYQRIGCRTVGIRFQIGTLEAIEHSLFIADARSGLLGRTHPLVWLLLWRRVANAMLRDGALAPRSAMDRANLLVLRTAGRILESVNL